MLHLRTFHMLEPRGDSNGPHANVHLRHANSSVWLELPMMRSRTRRTWKNIECDFSVLRGLDVNATLTQLTIPTEMVEDLSSSMTE
jgi:hypothetical protein